MASKFDNLVQGANLVVRQATTTATTPGVTTLPNNTKVFSDSSIPGDIIAIIVGGSVGGAIFLALVVVLVIWIRRRKAAKAAKAAYVPKEIDDE
jgi:hypothetical protein